MLLDPKLSILFDLVEAEAEAEAEAGVGAQVQGARGVPQRCGAVYAIQSRLRHTEPDRPSAARNDAVKQA